MRIVVLTLAMALQVACSPGRGEHIVTWPAVVFASDMMQAVSAVDESGIYAMLSTGEIAHVPPPRRRSSPYPSSSLRMRSSGQNGDRVWTRARSRQSPNEVARSA